MMKNIIRRLLRILDGTPAEYVPSDEKQKGQSLVEMAFITPLVLILIVGTAEIGWFANNYLILLEVSRVGARRGAVLTGPELGPTAYNDVASLVWTQPLEDIDPYWDQYGMTPNDLDSLRRFARLCGSESLGLPVEQQAFGFYYQIVCQMEASLLPLEMRTNVTDAQVANGVEKTDDIIISVFQVAMIENDTEANGGDYDFDGNGIDTYPKGPVPVVVGRYPSNANECNVVLVDESGTTVRRLVTLERDPFDWNVNNSASDVEDYIVVEPPPTAPPGAQDRIYYLELGRDVYAELADGTDLTRFDAATVPEMQRGWAYTGYHINRTSLVGEPLTDPYTGVVTVGDGELFCVGSEWDIADIEEEMLALDFELSPTDAAASPLGLALEYCTVEMEPQDPSDPDSPMICPPPGEMVPENVRRFYPSQGLVLVEVYWKHNLLLDLPGFSPVYNLVGGDSTVIYVWSMFPAPSVAPRIDFDPSWGELSD